MGGGNSKCDYCMENIKKLSFEVCFFLEHCCFPNVQPVISVLQSSKGASHFPYDHMRH